MTDVSMIIAQYMKQAGVVNYSIRPLPTTVASNTMLPSGRYYYINFQELSGFHVVTNNIVWDCTSSVADRAYSLAAHFPILHGQVHFIADDSVRVPPQKIVIIEIMYEIN